MCHSVLVNIIYCTWVHWSYTTPQPTARWGTSFFLPAAFDWKCTAMQCSPYGIFFGCGPTHTGPADPISCQKYVFFSENDQTEYGVLLIIH